MKKHGFRSIFSLLLAVMMVCSMLPTTAFAEGNVEEQPVVVETYTVTYADGMGGAAFAEQKTEGLLYGDPTPAFAGDPALDGYTFTGWDQEIAATVTQSVTYTALWQAVPTESQAEVAKESTATLTGEQGPNNEAVTYELNTSHKIDVTFTILYVSDEFSIGYNYGTSEKTQFVCQYSQPHSDTAYTNHTIAISDIKAAADRASVNSGYQIVGWSKEANENPKTWGFNLKDPTACNKGTTIYLVAKNPNPTTQYTYVLKYNANGGTGAPTDDSWSTTDAAIRYHSFTVTNTVPTFAGYTFKGWKAKDGSDTIYTGGALCSVSQQGNDIVKNGNTWTRTLYAVWEEEAPPKPDKPTAPGEDSLSGLIGNITVNCTNDKATHELKSKGYALISGSYTTSEVEGDAENGYTHTVTINSQKYVEQFDTDTGAAHDSKDVTATVVLEYTDNGWAVKDGTPVAFNVACAEASADDLTISVYLHVIGTDLSTKRFIGTDTAKRGKTYSIPSLNKFTTIKVGTIMSVTGNWDNDGYGKYPGWNIVWNPTSDEGEMIYHVDRIVIDKPTVDDLKGLEKGPVKVSCITKSKDHPTQTFSLMGSLEGTDYTIGEVTGNPTDGYTCVITVTAGSFVQKYNSYYGQHTLTGKSTETLRLRWNGTKWAVETPAVFEVACETTPPTDKPAVPEWDTIKNLTVKVVCPTHSSKDYGVVPAGLTAGEVQEQNGYYFCTVTIKSDAYVNDFNTKLGVEHTPKSDEKSVLLKYVDGTWVPNESTDSPVIFKVSCTTQEKPTEETIIKDLGNQVVGVACTTMPNVHGAIYSALKEGTFDISDVTTAEGQYPTCTITIRAETYLSAFNNGTGVTHLLKYLNVTSKTLQLYYANGKWTAALDGATPVVFEAVCPTAPVDVPTEEQIKAELGKIQVKCVTDGSGHAVKEYDTSVGGYTAETMQDNDGKPIYTVTITIPAQQYIEKYNEETGKTHQLASGEKAEKTVVLKYADKKWERVEGDLPVVFQVVCENIPAQKYTVTYTDGVDGVEVFKDQVYAGLTAGTATPAFSGTPARVGYVFAGWNPAVAATVTGNATYAATWKVDANNNGKPDDEELRYTVTYVDGANGKAFASQVYTGLLSGTATPKFNGTPLRSGYVFIGWSPVWSGTVTGNVTYTATWSTVTGGLDKVPKTGDSGLTLALSALVLFSFCGATACVISTKKRG